MTKKQREDFEAALLDIERSSFMPDPRTLAIALRILSARLDDLELTAEIARDRAGR